MCVTAFQGTRKRGNNKRFRWWKNKQKAKRKVLWNSMRGGMVQASIRRGGVEGGKELLVCMGRRICHPTARAAAELVLLNPVYVFCEGYLPCCRIGSIKSCLKCKKYLITVPTHFCLTRTAWYLTGSQQRLEGSVWDCITSQEHKKPHGHSNIVGSSGVGILSCSVEKLNLSPTCLTWNSLLLFNSYFINQIIWNRLNWNRSNRQGERRANSWPNS